MSDEPNGMVTGLAEAVLRDRIGLEGIAALLICLKARGIVDDRDVRFVLKRMREGVPTDTTVLPTSDIDLLFADFESEIEKLDMKGRVKPYPSDLA